MLCISIVPFLSCGRFLPRFPPAPIKLALGYLFIDEPLVMQAGVARSHSAVESCRRFESLVSEQLAHRFVCARLVVENGFRAEVPELMRGQDDACSLAQSVLDQQGDHRLA